MPLPPRAASRAPSTIDAWLSSSLKTTTRSFSPPFPPPVLPQSAAIAAALAAKPVGKRSASSVPLSRARERSSYLCIVVYAPGTSAEALGPQPSEAAARAAAARTHGCVERPR